MRAKDRNLIVAASAVALILLMAFLTNPDQATHLKAIKETAALRKPDGASGVNLMPIVHYNNYLIFSTTTIAEMTLTYGYFGRIQTTDEGIRFFSL